MNTETTRTSLTRPSDARQQYGSNVWQFNAGLAVAGAGVMLLMIFFVVSAVGAGWVADQDPSQLGRILAYDSWLFPAATAAVGLIKVGIALILWGIVRRLWIRVESLKESLPALIPALIGRSSVSPA